MAICGLNISHWRVAKESHNALVLEESGINHLGSLERDVRGGGNTPVSSPDMINP